MTDESDDSLDLFDSVAESGERDPPEGPLGLDGVANLIAWTLLTHDQEGLLEPTDRPRGILSPADREYLCGQKEYKHKQSEAGRKQDIRERIEHGLRDFKYLWLLLEPDERTKVFEKMGEEETNDCIEAMVSFAHLSLDQDLARLEERIQRGVLAGENASQGNRSTGKASNVDVSIDVDYDPDIKGISRKLTEGKTDQLTPEEIGVLVRSGKLEPEDLKKLENDEEQFPGVFHGKRSSDEQ